MGTSYLKNHLGFSLSEAEFEDIPRPAAELVTHVTIKTIQAGALLGTMVIGPLAALARASTRSLAGVSQKATRYGRNGVIIGAALGPVMTYARGKNFTDEQFRDRSFRLRHNRGQVHVDQGSAVGGVLGAGVGMMAGKPPLLGALLGISSGILATAAYNNKK